MKEICYKNNFLVEVVAKIDFAKPISSLNEAVLPEKIQEAIKARYKIYEPSKTVLQGIKISPQGVSSEQEEFNRWVYHGENREKSITISRDSIDVSLREYKNYDEFKLDVIAPVNKITELEGNIYISRTGFRFVNIFAGLTGTYKDISKYFHPMISSSFKNIINSEQCSRNFLITEYIHDEIKVRLQSGIYNPDYPAKIKKKDFIIDIDAYIDTPHSVSDANKLFDGLHKVIQDKFELCITKALRGVLNE